MSTVPTDSHVHTPTPTFEPRPKMLPNQEIVDVLPFDSVALESKSAVRLDVVAQRAVDAEGSNHAIGLYDQEDKGWSLTPDATLGLIVALAQAYTAVQVDRSEDGDAHTEAYGSAGSVWDLAGFESVVASQRFPFEGEPTEHNVVLRGYDATFSVESVPEFVRLLLVATADACTGTTEERAV